MYILAKRAGNQLGEFWYRIHGTTPNVSVARAWYRSTRTTDVFEVTRGMEEPGSWTNDVISETKLESWREQHARESLEAAKQQTA